jgi:ribonucleoside-diphosphate reductase alpha chain
VEIPFTENGRRIFDLRYPRKDESGQPAETPEQTIERVVSNVAIVNALYDEPTDEAAEIEGSFAPPLAEFPWRTALRQAQWLRDTRGDADYIDRIRHSPGFIDQQKLYRQLLSSLTFLPNSPTWTGAGTPLGQLAACFVLPIEDDLAEGRSSIFEMLKIAVAIQQTGGGNGFSFARLRPQGSLVKRSMGQASGPLGFLKVYDAAFGEIAQGGSRRGANMGVLRVDHPDIRHFIRAKVVEGEIANFNISVAITDEFMDAVEKDGPFDLRWGGTVYETVQAIDLYDEIINNAWVIGDPGNLFIDRANAQNPVPVRYDLEATNPCGEQWLGPFENCCLGSIAVNRFVTEWFVDGGKKIGRFDWEGLREAVELSTQFLDDVVDANQYVGTVPELEAAAQGGRRIGLGIMGMADTMLMMGLRYGSQESLDFASQLMEFVRFHTMLTSIERAKERGPFEWIEGSIYDPKLLSRAGVGCEIEHKTGKQYRLWAPPESIIDHSIDFGRPECDWDLVVDGIKGHGIRNCCQLTIAPTGTISNVAGCEGSGCEPLFALSYVRTVMQEGENIELHYLSPLFRQVLDVFPVNESEIVQKVAANNGSCQGIDEVPSWLREVFVVAADIEPTEHVRMQAVLQAWVDNAISKTINLPYEATPEDVSEVYRLAYSLGCKGITVYRQGSRELEVLATSKDDKTQAVEWPHLGPIPLPSDVADRGLAARIFPVETFFGKVQVAVSEIEGHPNRPFDVRLQLGKAGSDKMADVEALGRMISLALRTGVDVRHIIEQLEGIGGQSIHGFGPSRVKSVPDGIGKLLRRLFVGAPEPQIISTVEIIPRESIDTSTVCPECNQASLVMEAGCRHCDIRLGGCGQYSGCD